MSRSGDRKSGEIYSDLPSARIENPELGNQFLLKSQNREDLCKSGSPVLQFRSAIRNQEPPSVLWSAITKLNSTVSATRKPSPIFGYSLQLFFKISPEREIFDHCGPTETVSDLCSFLQRRPHAEVRIKNLDSIQRSLILLLIRLKAMEEASKLAPKQTLEKAKRGLLQSNELYQYILETSVYPREPELLKELRDATISHPWSAMATASDGGQLMALLLKLINSKKTIEIGVFTGYSLLLTALSIPDDGKIIAIDKNQEAYEIGLPIIKKAGVEHKIDFIKSLALPVLDKLLENPTNEGSFDFAYVDADKINYWNYHERLLKLVRIGGIIAYDNTLWGGTVALPDDSLLPDYSKASRPHIIKFNKSLASDPRVQISQVPLGCCSSRLFLLPISLKAMEEASKLAANQILNNDNKGLLQSDELFQYVLETSVYPRESELLKELRVATYSHPLYEMATSPDEGQLMALLLKLINAKKTIEIGVFTGYSLLLTALSIPDDGKIIAIDENQDAYEIGLPIIKKAGVEHKIDFIDSLALPVLDKLLENPTNDGSFDFAYVDADKINYWNYHERLLKLVRIGGIIAYDNTLWGGTVALPDDSLLPYYLKASRPHIIKFNKSLASDPRVQISQVPSGDGVTICLRLY
ncbi:hypothetical protein MRB53_017697 [Persea americana]|uniref:Uncharacterized protein n=1 Tax=Persea americana TaxID=3435 RepID=A0ACC2M5V9_PERAE|nr:hypothetical protein MRB53_017697 [Persea americana]